LSKEVLAIEQKAPAMGITLGCRQADSNPLTPRNIEKKQWVIQAADPIALRANRHQPPAVGRENKSMAVAKVLPSAEAAKQYQ
jgi:hypothetical protein